MEIRYKKGLLRFCEVWFNKELQVKGRNELYADADVLVFHESHVPVLLSSSPLKNGVLTLDISAEQLFATFDRAFRNNVRRASKEGIVFNFGSTMRDLDAVYSTYKQFCKNKQIAFMSYFLLKHYAQTGHLLISKAMLGNSIVQSHIYLVEKEEAILLASIPIDGDVSGQLLGWTNRALHWADIVRFKEAGLLRYNLGGMGNPVTEHNRSIVAFKQEMHPAEVIYYHDTVPISQLGKVYFFLKEAHKMTS